METASETPRESGLGAALTGLRLHADLASEVAAGVASGLTEATRQRAVTTARTLVAAGETNTELVLAVVRSEVERQLARLPVPSIEQVSQLRERVERLEGTVAVLEQRLAQDSASAEKPARAPRRRAAPRPAESTTAAPASRRRPRPADEGTQGKRA